MLKLKFQTVVQVDQQTWKREAVCVRLSRQGDPDRYETRPTSWNDHAGIFLLHHVTGALLLSTLRRKSWYHIRKQLACKQVK